MNRAYGIAALVGVLGISAANPSTLLAQVQNEPIKFGQKGETTYNIVRQPYSEESHIITSNIMGGQNWGQIYLDKNGGFVAVGILEDGTQFLYEAGTGILGNSLTLVRNGLKTTFHDSEAGSFGMDDSILDEVQINFGTSNFYEGPRPVPTAQGSDLSGRLHDLYSNYTRWLNVDSI